MSEIMKVAYKPISLLASLGAAALAGRVVRLIWQQAANEDELPDVLNAESPVGKVLAAALIQAGVFAIAHTLIDRGAARLYERITGAWPGEE